MTADDIDHLAVAVKPELGPMFSDVVDPFLRRETPSPYVKWFSRLLLEIRRPAHSTVMKTCSRGLVICPVGGAHLVEVGKSKLHYRIEPAFGYVASDATI